MRAITRLLSTCFILTVFWTLCPAWADAMQITTSEMPLAWNRDGNACLLCIHEHGPEGGGLLAYRLIDADGSDETWILSNDFGPGDGSTPQAVNAEECAAKAAAMREALAKAGFLGVRVDMRQCHAAYRNAFVIVSPVLAQALASGEFAKDHGRLVLKHLALMLDGGKIVLETLGQQISADPKAALPEACRLKAWVSPSGRLIAVFAESASSQTFAAAFYTPDGDVRSYQPLTGSSADTPPQAEQ